jgi:O-antigen ligase
MKLFAIHAPIGPVVLSGLESARAARTGFSFAALLFGPLWLLARGLWLALIGYLVLAALVVGLARYGWLAPVATLALFVLAALYLGFEGRAVAVAARGRSGRPLVDVIYARGALEAEKLYFERALAAFPATARSGVARAEDGIIGSFPEPRR